VSRRSRVWIALVEVKTGRNELEAEQLENYLEVARRHGLQALLTISNQTPVADGVHPTKIDKRSAVSVTLTDEQAKNWAATHRSMANTLDPPLSPTPTPPSGGGSTPDPPASRAEPWVIRQCGSSKPPSKRTSRPLRLEVSS
jgi:hypothetical protein